MTDQSNSQGDGSGNDFLDAEAMAHRLTERLRRLDDEAARYTAAAGKLEESREASEKLVEEVREAIAELQLAFGVMKDIAQSTRNGVDSIEKKQTLLDSRVDGLVRRVNVVMGLGVAAVAALVAAWFRG